MAINNKERSDIIAVSRMRQVADGGTGAAENPQTVDALIYFDEGSKVEIADSRDTNKKEKTGREEATKIDIGEREASGTLTKSKAQPDVLAWAFAMITNDHSEDAAGVAGFVHTSRMSYATEPSFFSLIHRKGNLADARRHTGLMIDSLSLTMAKGANLSLTLGLKGLGKYDDQRYTEVVQAPDNATSLPFTKDINGGSVDHVTVWADTNGDGSPDRKVTVTQVNNTANQLTIASLGGPGNAIDYHLIYAPKHDVAGYTWADLSALAAVEEFHPRAKDIQLILGGVFNGTDIAGGQIAKCEINNVNYQYNANAKIQKCFRSSAVPVDHASGVDFGEIVQTVNLDRDIVDYIMGYWHQKNMCPALKIHAVSPVEFETGHRYEVEVLFPKIGFLDNKHTVLDGKWTSQSKLVVLKDDSADDYPTVVFKVKNQQSGYFA